MQELLIALLPVVILALLAVLITYGSFVVIGAVALLLLAVGSLLGLPCGIWYHVLLRRELLKRGGLPKGWLWRPTQQHRLLDFDARDRVRRWFLLGGAGFAMIVLGALLGVVAIGLWYRASGAGWSPV